MSETEIESGSSAWLAAYALGLVASHDPTALRGPCAGELARAAAGDRAALARARSRLADVATVGEALRAAAVTLIGAAMELCPPRRMDAVDARRPGLAWTLLPRFQVVPAVPWPGTREVPTEPDPCGSTGTPRR